MNDGTKIERSIFNKLTEEQRNKLFEAGNVISLKKGQELFGERETVKSMYIVVDGYVALFRNSRYGELKVIFICTNGEIINEVVLQDEKTSISTKALSDTKLLAINREAMYQLLAEDYNLTKRIYDSLAMKTRRLYHQVGNANGTYPLEKRLAAKIWKLARDYGKDTPQGRQISFDTTVTFLASMLGAKRETISRIISQMKNQEIILHEKGVITVVSMDELKLLAK